ncbi:MAG: cysteine rich repeat-containing protein [bacterium]|nr:cysteine rich repeat-containing protein [bacterium]
MSIFSTRRLAVFGGSTFAICAAVILLSAGGRPVFSEKPEGGKQRACSADIKKFCGGIEKGEGRIMQCLEENRASVSSECRTKLEKREERRAKFDAACGNDAKQFCGEKRGKELRACMKENREKLSTGCSELISKARTKKKEGKEQRKEKRKAVAKACRADARKVCKGIKPGDGKLMACLQEKRSELSQACAAVLPAPAGQ